MAKEGRVFGDHQVQPNDFPNGETEDQREKGLTQVKNPGLLIPTLF